MFTSHGWHIPGTERTSPSPMTVAKCGGPTFCPICAQESLQATSTMPGVMPPELQVKDFNAQKKATLRRAFSEVMNAESVDNDLDIPDYILADYLVGCLELLSKNNLQIETHKRGTK